VSKKDDHVLFSVLIDRSGGGLSTDFISERAARTHRCVQDLLLVTGIAPQLSHQVDKVGKDWVVIFRVSPNFMTQLDLFEARRAEQPTVKEVGVMVIEAAVVAIRRFRQETVGVVATRIEQTLKQLRSADPRVIAALSKQPAKTLTVRNEVGDFSLSVQSESLRPVSAEAEPLIGFIKTVGYDEMTVQPVNKRSPAHVCIHTFRIRIPEPLQSAFDPVKALDEFVRPKVRVQILVQREDVVRRRDHVTFLLAEWPATTL
jgi:hypothetical protein